MGFRSFWTFKKKANSRILRLQIDLRYLNLQCKVLDECVDNFGFLGLSHIFIDPRKLSLGREFFIFRVCLSHVPSSN